MRHLLVATLCSLLAACATVSDGTLESTETITFVSTPTGAAIKTPGRTICYTPCRQTVPRRLISELYAELPGYDIVAIDPSSEFNAMVIGNAVVGGLPGLGIDILTGRASRVADVVKIEFGSRSEDETENGHADSFDGQ